MRTNIDLNDELVQQAMLTTGAKTKKALVEYALRLVIRTEAQTGIDELWGTVEWEGDLKQSRMGRLRE